jgi:energy-coupling factor transporter ATP-binding protein EcfA2
VSVIAPICDICASAGAVTEFPCQIHGAGRVTPERAAPPEVEGLQEQWEADEEEVTRPPEVVGGGAFIFDDGRPVPAKWGHDDAPLWAEGESLFLAGAPGTGKSTLAQRVVLGLLELGKSEVLGLPVRPIQGRVLYVAADRPRQIARSFRRMVSEDQRDELDERLVVRKGPLPFDLVKDPWRLAVFVQSYGCRHVVIDSLKDVAVGLSKDEVGGAVNQALQHCLAGGVEVLVVHHNRKSSADNPRPKALDDVFGSAWLTGGAGSVVLLWAPEPGSPLVELHHVKAPAHEVGPLEVVVDIDAGDLRLGEAVDLLAVVRGTPKGLSATGAAVILTGKNEPTRGEVQKARRKLEHLKQKGLVQPVGGGKNEHGRQVEILYFPTVAEPTS